jgi:hypothetical protein
MIFGGTTDAFLQPFDAIVSVLIAHLFDGDPVSVDAPIPLFKFWSFRQNPPVDILQPLIDLSRTEAKPSGALAIIAEFCGKSQQAVLTLADAMAADQPYEKRLAAMQAISYTSAPTCTDPKLVDALSTALKSDPPPNSDTVVTQKDDGQGHIITTYSGRPTTILEAAITAAQSIGRAAGPANGPLRADLERLAADQGHPKVAQAAQAALYQLNAK